MLGYWKWLLKLLKNSVKWIFSIEKTKESRQIWWAFCDAIIVMIVVFWNGFTSIGFIISVLGVILTAGHMVYIDIGGK